MPVTSDAPGMSAAPRTISPRLLWLLGLSGVLSALFIVAATVVGVGLRPGFDHFAYTISELYEVGAPNALGLMMMFTTYHALVVPLALGLHVGLPPSRHGWVGPALLGAAGALGIPLGAWARCDPGCFGATTFRGQMHAVLVLLTVPLIYGAMLATWRRLRQHPAWHSYARYTLTTVLIGLAFGLGMTPFIRGPYAGLLERISVAIMLQWYVVMGLRVMKVAQRQALARAEPGFETTHA